MPIYAYRCESCGFSKDVLQKMSDAPLTDCPQCSAPSFRKQLTAAGFQLKGSGWYVTDFRDKSSGAPAAKTETGTPVSSDSSTAKPAETAAKPESTSAPAPAPAPVASSTPSSGTS